MDTRVFVCEDADGIQFFIGDLLQTIGGLEVVGSASTEPDAKFWLLANQAEWEIAIVDLVLEQGSGLGVITAARETHPAGRVIVFSSYATPAIRSHCLSMGAEQVFAKTEATAFSAWLAAQVQGGGGG
ncbi:MAG TPA: response regulator [Ramlibacter sp.]|uniref:response regulator n=1 Tax=Ramlibacter sp. TaxID=1917967 RepID=UPI002D801C66|nr:response regulator [Ramlibacter sp.]HET8748697.1 response regulator [Ramlibacter sp.]